MAASIDAAILALSRRQHGNITRKQLLRLGLGPAAITFRARCGRLHRVHRGVYSVGRPPGTPLELAAAAVLACGPGAALSHGSALTLWGLAKRWQTPLHVSAPTRRRRPGIVIHESPLLTRREIRSQLGIRVTSPARTLLDCAPVLNEDRLGRVAADWRRSGQLHLSEVAELTRRFPHHPGCSRLAPLLQATGAPTRSEFEDAFLVFCRRFALPTPIVNTVICGYEVDALFAAERLIVELDGWDFHRDRSAFERDRNRDADTLASGIATVRITWTRLTRDPHQEAGRLEAILEARRRG